MDLLLVIILALVAGLMQSFVYTLAFIKNNNDWIKSIITIGVISIMFTEAFYFKNNFPNFFEEKYTFIVFVISFFLSTTGLTFLFIRLIYKHHNKKSSPIKKVSFGEFIVTPYEILKLDYSNPENQEQYQKNIEDIKIEIEKKLKENKNFSLLNIPLNHPIIIDDRYLNKYISYVDTISKYICYLNAETQKFLKAKKNKKNVNTRTFKNYLETLSSITCVYLFDSNKHEIRIHFRMLNTETNNFEKYYTYENKQESQETLTPMSANTGIIKEAINSKRSLVKSANLNLHQKAKNDNQWKNYITMIFNSITNDEENPCFSMTISIHDDELYTDLLYFLSYIQFERYVENNIKKVYQQYKITCEEIK